MLPAFALLMTSTLRATFGSNVSIPLKPLRMLVPVTSQGHCAASSSANQSPVVKPPDSGRPGEQSRDAGLLGPDQPQRLDMAMSRALKLA